MSVNSSVFMLCCSCEITRNMVFQLLKSFNVEINFEWSHLDKRIYSGCLHIDYIRKLSQRISASSSKGVKFLIKELLCTHIASHLLPSISWLVATWKHVNSFPTSTVDKTNYMSLIATFLCKLYVKCLWFCYFLSYTACIVVGKQLSLC